MRIGDLQLVSNLSLAPLAGYCDLGFRLVVRSLGGLGLVSTDLICARAMVADTPKTLRLLETCAEDQPLCVQLFGAEERWLTEAARRAVDRGAAVVDLNMGCPVDKVTRRKGGAALLRDLPLAVRLAEAMVGAVSVPVTAKTRLGPDDAHPVAPRLAAMLADVGVAALTIHGRTTAQQFRGSVNLEGIAEVVSAGGDMPVIGNGDIRRAEDAAAMIARTGCAGVMIGRGALRDPWIFRDTDALLRTGRVPAPPSLADRVELMMRHFEHIASSSTERRTRHIVRHRLHWYTKMFGPCRPFKERAAKVESLAELRELASAFVAQDERSSSSP